MKFPTRLVLVQLATPLVLALPAALVFLHQVLAPSRELWVWLVSVVTIAYALGAVPFVAIVASAARKVEDDVVSRRDPSVSVSACLDRTELAAAALWVLWGLLLGLIGAAAILPTFLGFQYFAEAALIVAAPAMAWSYWTGKRMLVAEAGDLMVIGYTGRLWSVGTKIAMVFTGFFVVSVGAIVLFVSSRVSQTLGQEAAYGIAGFSLMIALVTALLFSAATWFLSVDITAPMRALVVLTGEMAEGRFDTEPRIFSDDQVGTLARSFATTRQTLRGLIARIRSSGGVITDGVSTMTAGTRSLIEGAHEQSGLAEHSTESIHRVRDEAQSVLENVERVTDRTADSASRAAELRASSHEVNRRAEELLDSAEKSASAASEIDATARELTRRTTELSSAGSDLLVFVTEMDTTISQITQTADATTSLSKDVRQKASDGRTAVDATVNGIREVQEATRRTASAFEGLQKSLSQIDQILEFIDDVTRQTNLLALNAAIIAAHAGQGDYGFSVIADEVRQLSDRTGGATKQISGIIRGVQPVMRQALGALEEGVQSVDRTVDVANRASTALGAILTSADHSLQMTQGISTSLQEQARASEHLHRVVEQMTDHLTEMHRATEEQAEGMRQLAEEAERVQDVARIVKRASMEQTEVEDGIARSMESIVEDVRAIRDRLGNQLAQTRHIAANSDSTLTIARRNNGIAEDFGAALGALVRQSEEFAAEVARFRA